MGLQLKGRVNKSVQADLRRLRLALYAMKKLSIVVLVACILSGCFGEEGEPGSGAAMEPIIEMDRGVQCFDETKSSDFEVGTVVGGIRKDLADYLNLEYGAPELSEALQSEDLEVVGIYEACGKGVKVWSYPCGDKDCFVAIQPWRDTYLTTMIGSELLTD